MNPRCVLAFGLAPLLVFGQATPTSKQAPPPGIRISAAESDELNSRLEILGREIETLRTTLKSHPDLLALLPDVQVFHKAVRDAVAYNEFFKPSEIELAREQLTIGLQRATELRKLASPWTAARGSLVRAYRSRIDDSVQPYGLRVPEDWKPEDRQLRPLYLWFHGRNETLSEVAFIAGQLKGRREFAPTNAFELHLYGRYCNASKFAGEVDAFEAMADVMRHYRIDTNRMAALGFSMGGASAWHMAAHHPGVWAVTSAGAGFAETAIYAKVFDQKKEAPPLWERTLWRLYDATACAANLANVPMIAYSGEIDPQKQSADIMEKAMAEEGLKLERLVGPNTAHKYEPETKKELSRRIDAAIAKGRDLFPRHVRFVTYTLRYNQMKWITLDQLEKHWDRAEIDAEIGDDALRVKTRNVTAFTITLPERPQSIIIDGEEISQGGATSFCKLDGKWQRRPAEFGTGLHKRHGLTGPIDDAFMDAFIFVRPTGKVWNERVGAWAGSELERAIVEWRRVFRGDARVKNDTEITAEDIARNNLVLWGDPGSNRLLAKILPNLPLEWTQNELMLGAQSVSASDHAPVLIFPNPLNRERYVVINSGFTFRQGSTTSNSLQTPKLPDWAIVDLRTPPSLKWPGRIVSAGFFDDQWKLPPR
ncbi:MAG: prolyl oligopeptidase family serine peptidase [Verrucomicrobia bacterium]|nr:prolyl oligopeptidase family serine peptidase [Verrucomicrobiota bacterium]